MNLTEYILVSDFCRGHALEETFLYELHEIELIRIVELERQHLIHMEDLDRLERLVRLHRDLEIAPQGLLAIDHLLGRVEALQEEVLALKRKLDRWE